MYIDIFIAQMNTLFSEGLLRISQSPFIILKNKICFVQFARKAIVGSLSFCCSQGTNQSHVQTVHYIILITSDTGDAIIQTFNLYIN